MAQETSPRSTTLWPLAVIGIAVALSLVASLHRPATADRLVFAAGEIRHRRLPLWDSTAGFGAPMATKGPLAEFSPTVLPLMLPVKWGWPLREAMRLSIAGLGMGWLAWLWGARDAKLLVITASYLVCGAILGQMRDSSEEAWIWLPCCALAIGWLIDRITPARVVLTALTFSLLFLSGDSVPPAVPAWEAGAVMLICLAFLASRMWHGRPAHVRGTPRPSANGKEHVGVSPMPLLKAVLATFAVVFAMILAFGITGIVWLPHWEHRHAIAPAVIKPPAKAWFVRNYKWYPTRDDARRATSQPSFDPKAIVLLHNPTSPDWQTTIDRIKANPPATRASGGFFSRPRTNVPIVVNEAIGAHWRIELPDEDGWIVVAQSYDDGWSGKIVRLNRFGRSSQDIITLPADGGLLAIPVFEQGTGELHLDYHPLAWRHGAIVSAASGVACLLLLGLSIAGRKRTIESPPTAAAYIATPAPAL